MKFWLWHQRHGLLKCKAFGGNMDKWTGTYNTWVGFVKPDISGSILNVCLLHSKLSEFSGCPEGTCLEACSNMYVLVSSDGVFSGHYHVDERIEQLFLLIHFLAETILLILSWNVKHLWHGFFLFTKVLISPLVFASNYFYYVDYLFSSLGVSFISPCSLYIQHTNTVMFIPYVT